MNFRFPLDDVTINITTEKKVVENPNYNDGFYRVSQNEFSMEVEGVASFYASEGKKIEIFPAEGYNLSTLELYLNGSVYGAILHQRQILPLHGSCFNYNGMGIMICGESGAGKSSVTASFCLNGAEFLTDDVTPVQFINGKPHIWALSDRIKLWADSLEQLEQTKDGLNQIDSETEKFYYPINDEKGKLFPLHHIFVLSIDDKPEVHFQEIKGVEKFATLRNEIYRWEYLEGMKETEKVYLPGILKMNDSIRITQVIRPQNINLNTMYRCLSEYITKSF